MLRLQRGMTFFINIVNLLKLFNFFIIFPF